MSLSSAIPTLKTLGVGVGGACLARLLHMPLPDLTGPALCVSAAGLAGLQMGLDDRVRNIAFVILGMTAQAKQMLVHSPLAFVALMRFFKFDVQSGLLAALPGHMPLWLAISAVVVLGALISTRFGGVHLEALKAAALARILALAVLVPVLFAQTQPQAR